jgi:hypothetical protein
MQVVVQKIQVKPLFSFEQLDSKQETNLRRMLAEHGIQAQGKQP